MTDPIRTELLDLLDALCEDRITSEQHAQIERLVLSDHDARRLYVDYVGLHGMLYWDAATAARLDTPKPLPAPVPSQQRPGRRRRLAILTMAAACLVAAVVLLFTRPGNHQQLADTDPQASANTDNLTGENGNATVAEFPTVRLDSGENDNSPGSELIDPPETAVTSSDAVDDVVSDPEMVAFIDEQIAAVRADAGVEPSPRADDAEWVRRIYLDVAGHVPAPAVAEQFIASEDPEKRIRLVNRLLEDPDYARHLATVWTNQLVGRAPERPIDRPALEEFLRDQFAANRGWDETVTELIAAEGSSHENGAANFLLAHLNNEAVPATAVTSRVFLGLQVQCTQCHKHPYYKEWGQEQFWGLNAFFKQTGVVRRTTTENGRARFSHLELVTRDVGGETLYEDRNGVMKAALPEFDGHEIDPGAGTNRRAELARLMTDGESSQLAAAFVNRLWAHFFGFGFTNPVDDMGPHHPPTHPELLGALSDEFVRSGYDVKRLIRWITSSEAYHLTSRAVDGNLIDNPAVGDPPYFSRMYIKPLSAEQLFDSVLVATQVDRGAGASLSETVDARRREWLDQFFKAVDTEENSELTTFDGTLPQALMMMNGDLVRQAVSGAPGTYLGEVLLDADSETDDRIRRLSLAALSRYPTRDEMEAIRTVLRNKIRTRTRQGMAPSAATNEALRDVFWAYLNSSEFSVNH
jgi:hypothetical protein